MPPALRLDVEEALNAAGQAERGNDPPRPALAADGAYNQRRQKEQLILRNFFSPVEPPCRACLCRYMALLTPD